MAPTSNSAKAMQHNRPRPTVPKPIVPAIPLPYIQKRQQQLAARENAKEEAAQTQVVEQQSSPAPSLPETAPATVNGPSDTHSTEKSEEGDGAAGKALARDEVKPTIPVQERGELRGVSNREESEASVQEKASDKALETHSIPSDGPSSASRSTFQMPPPFVPANQSQSNATAFNPVKFPPQQVLNGHHASQASPGSVVFGGYPESNTSSPAPPLSAGNVPPYPFQQLPQAGRHVHHPSNGTHTQHMTNGFSPLGPPPPGYYLRQDNFMNQGPGSEIYARRQMVSFGPPNGQSPSGTPSGFDNPRFGPYDPSTPRSFHGSQSSAPNEQDNNPAFYSQYPNAVNSSGSNGHIDDVRLYQQTRMKPRPGTQPLAPPHGTFPMGLSPAADDYDGLLAYLGNQFADAELADYTLELRYSDDRAPPVRIPGHNLMFARSPYLKSLMKAQPRESSGLSVQPLFIESDDRFLRSDGFWMAVQRLYGGPLLDLGAAAMHHLPRSARQTSPMPGTPADRFDLALGYAAAGRILQIPPVINRGAEIACMLINWDTVEKALDFAIDGGLDSQWTCNTQPDQTVTPSTYGPAVNMIIFSALTFIITSFPPNFELDTSVPEPSHNRRLPTVPQDRSAAPNPRLSFIKFGDHPSEDSVKSETANSIPVTLSKVLLNLPFHLLKFVLESPRLGNVEGWANNTLRQKAMHAVIEEREKRRLKILASPHVPERTPDQFDDTVRWQEAVDTHGGHEGNPVLIRTWFEKGVPSSDK